MSGQSSEVIHCPNCKEDVPKTLYCLNCGYPLYKLDKQKKDEEGIEESKLEPVDEVDMSVEIQQPDPIKSILEIEPEEKDVFEDPEPNGEEIKETEPEEKDVFEDPEPNGEEIKETEPMINTTIEVEDEIQSEMEEDSLVPEPEVIINKSITESFIQEERESYIMDEIILEFAPDPLTKEVMENLAKNITLKIRLVRLLCESQVKEETFKKLFDSYVDQGRLWISRRDEIIIRFKNDIDRKEQELITAKKDYELLEIRKNIGDASEEEYNVKSPAYKWDIENLDKEIKNSRGSIQYVINLESLIPEEEVDELKNMVESDFSELTSLEGVTEETVLRMKETLSEALNTLDS